MVKDYVVFVMENTTADNDLTQMVLYNPHDYRFHSEQVKIELYITAVIQYLYIKVLL